MMGPVMIDIKKFGTIDTLRYMGVPDELAERWGWWGGLTYRWQERLIRRASHRQGMTHSVCAYEAVTSPHQCIERFVELESSDGETWTVVTESCSGCAVGTRFCYGVTGIHAQRREIEMSLERIGDGC
jgi:hypothetical protein